MVKIGMFDSYYTNETFNVIDSIFDKNKLITMMINADKYSGDNIDILVVNKKPSIMSINRKPFAVLCDTAVINADDKLIIKYLTKTNTQIVTYGFNTRSSVTASSILDDRAVFCVQRSFHTLNGDVVYEQEFSVNTMTSIDREYDKRTLIPLCNKNVIKKTRNFVNNSIDYSQFMINCLLPAVTSALVAGASVNHIVKNMRV